MSAMLRLTPEAGKALIERQRLKTSAISNVEFITSPTPKRSKHGSERTLVDGDVVDSKKEAKRLIELRAMGRAGLINELAHQVEFFLGVQTDEDGRAHVCKYVADFVYVDMARQGARVVEDVKSEHSRTLPVYRLKKRLMRALLGIEIVET